MLEILTVILPLFIIIFVGALLQKFHGIGTRWSAALNEYALKIAFPVLIFSALAKTHFSFSENISLMIANSIFILLTFGLIFTIGKIFKFSHQMLRTLFVCGVFGNVAYLGIPVTIQIYGESLIPTTSLVVAIYLLLLFTVGIGYLEFSLHKKHPGLDIIKNFIKNPLLLAVILGLFIGALNIQLPSILIQSLDMISASATPVVLIVIGFFIGSLKIGKLSKWKSVFLFSFFTLILVPLIFYLTANFFNLSSLQFKISFIEAAMPLAITPFALADQYKLNKTFIAHSIVLSTILSILSIPFWISVL